MYLDIQETKNKTYIFLRKSVRDKKSGKIKKITIANLTEEKPEQVIKIVNALRGNECIDIEKLQPGKTIGFSLVIYFIMKLLGILKVITKSYEAKIATMLIAARIIIQSSRLQALYWSKEEDHILDIVGFNKEEKDKLNNKTIYLGLDYIQKNQQIIEDKLFKIYYKNNPPKRVYYDITSSYVEGDYENSKLVKYGYNRDKKNGKKQIVIGLLVDENAHAISIQTYPGNTNDIKTFTDQLDKLKHRFNLDNITVVGDGGMIKSEDINKIKELGYDYITSISKASIKKLISNDSIQLSFFDIDLKEIIEDDIRYILRKNPVKEQEIKQNRDDKIKYLKDFIKEKTNYYNTHYKAKKQTLQDCINKKISDLKLSSFISVKFNYKDGEVVIKHKDNNKKDEIKTKPLVTIDLIIDGCYVIKTSLTDINKDTKEDIHKAYKNLVKVENAFKILKTEFLEIRPLYLKTDNKIIGHVALSMIAYNIVLKLKEYINLANLDFYSTIRLLEKIQTLPVQLTKKISITYITKVNDKLQQLFNIMGFKMPQKVKY